MVMAFRSMMPWSDRNTSRRYGFQSFAAEISVRRTLKGVLVSSSSMKQWRSVGGLVRILWVGALVPLELDSVIFWQNIFDHLDVALYSCGSEGNSRSAQLSCLVPATPG